MLDNIGTPVLSLVTGFLKTNPVAAKAAQTFAAAPATQAFIKSISGIAIGIGPAEKAALVRLVPYSRHCGGSLCLLSFCHVASPYCPYIWIYKRLLSRFSALRIPRSLSGDNCISP